MDIRRAGWTGSRVVDGEPIAYRAALVEKATGRVGRSSASGDEQPWGTGAVVRDGFGFQGRLDVDGKGMKGGGVRDRRVFGDKYACRPCRSGINGGELDNRIVAVVEEEGKNIAQSVYAGTEIHCSAISLVSDFLIRYCKGDDM